MKTCWTKFAFFLVVAWLGLGQLLTACGQSGSLYLPTEKTSAENSAKTSTSTTPSANSKKESATKSGTAQPSQP